MWNATEYRRPRRRIGRRLRRRRGVGSGAGGGARTEAGARCTRSGRRGRPGAEGDGVQKGRAWTWEVTEFDLASRRVRRGGERSRGGAWYVSAEAAMPWRTRRRRQATDADDGPSRPARASAKGMTFRRLRRMMS
jgi:hypothetical protein